MVIDANGVPIQLSNYFSDNGRLETSDKETKWVIFLSYALEMKWNWLSCDLSKLRVAFKMVGFKDQTQVKVGLNGIVSFQIRLLEELGYKTVVVSWPSYKSN